MSDTKYRPEIDGLRAFAVLPVVFFHMGAAWMPGGYAGVDVFFVISGFLITRLILADLDRDTFKFSEFWLRRVRRILPALITMVVATSIIGRLMLYSIDVNDIGNQGIAALLSVANFFFWIRTGSYWGPSAEDSMLLHTWTLSVEEQFYLFFPLLLVVLVKYFRDRLTVLVMLMVVLSLGLFISGSKHNPTATFYLLPTRAWELGSGCLLAVIAAERPMKYASFRSEVLTFVGLVAIIAPYFLMSNQVGMAGGLVFPVLGTVLVIAGSSECKGITNKVLTAGPVIYIGKISYSLYLWHWPLIVLFSDLPFEQPLVKSTVLILIVFLCSIASYHLVEQTTRRRKRVVRYIVCGFAVGILLSLSLSSHDHDVSSYSATTWKGKQYNVGPKQDFVWQVEKIWHGITAPAPTEPRENLYATGGVIKHHGDGPPQVVVLGDSHALMWAPVIDDVARELMVTVSFYAADGTPAFFDVPPVKARASSYFSVDQKYTFDRKRLEFLESWKPKVVVVAARWGNVKSVDQTKDLLDFLEQIGSTVLLMEQPTEIFAKARNTPKYLAFLGMHPTKHDPQYIKSPELTRYVDGALLLRTIAQERDNCEIIHTADVFARGTETWVLDGADVLYIDANHLSFKGALKARSRILKSLGKHL